MMSRRGAATLLATAAVVFAACSSGRRLERAGVRGGDHRSDGRTGDRRSGSPSAAAVTINWYHIQNNDPGKGLWQKLADEYTAAHPNVTVNITVLENEAFKTKLTTLLQAGTPPDLFQSWGGGGLREQQTAGLVKDITADVSSWASEINPGALGMYQVDGKQYGIPFDLGMVGFWYNKSQFAKAGITAPPATWDDLLADVGKLKTAGADARSRWQARTPGPARSSGPISRSANAARPAWTRPSRPVTGPTRASSRPAPTSRS